MTEWDAQQYHRNNTLQQTMAEEQLALLHLQGTERILDVGCGDGRVTAQIAARVPRGSVLGVDPSHQMIAFASQEFSPAAHPNLRFEVADARTLPYRNQFDLVVSFNALHWVQEQEMALRAIRTALKPGGQAVLRFVGETERISLEDVVEVVRKEGAWTRYFPQFKEPHTHLTPAQYRVLAEAAGFAQVSVQLLEKTWDFGTRKDFAGFSRAIFVAWLEQLPSDKQDAFIDEVLDRYASLVAEHPGEVHTFKFAQMEVLLQAPGSV